MSASAVPGADVEILISPSELDPGSIAGRGVVVIDVLRATTVLARALSAGAVRVAPAGSVAAALDLRAEFGEALLCGERGGRKIEGFDLGNSPLEYEPRRVRGRTLILASTNGTVILARCDGARRVLTASFNNAAAVARAVLVDGGRWTIVPGGKLGRACLEDVLCAGYLADLIDPSGAEGPPADTAGDGVRIARSLLSVHGGDLRGALGRSSHGRYLASIGFAEDIAACAERDTFDVVPELHGRWIAAAPAPPRTGGDA